MIPLRGKYVILDSDVAELYGVETRDINKSVKNNPSKFPKGYIFEVDEEEIADLQFKKMTTISTKSRVLPKAFTEKGLYMLATILKSEKATERTIEIVETYAKMRELSRAIGQLSEAPEEKKQKALMQRSGEIMSEILGQDLKTSDTETSLELNLRYSNSSIR